MVTRPDSEPPCSQSPARRWCVRYRHRVLIQRSILPFTWPILVELICVVLMGIVSTILVSRIGKDATAAVGITDSVTYIILSLLTAIALGGSVLIAQAFGRRDRQKALFGASQVMNLGVLVSVVCCVAMFLFARPILAVVAYGAEPEVIALADQYLKMIALSYPALAITLSGSGILRAVGNSRSPATTNILMNILNIIISYPLIYGIDALHWSGLGMLGAGIGISAARWIGAGMILFVLTHNGSLRVPANEFLKPFSRPILREILVIGVPASVESLMFNIGKLITQIMVAGMGTIVMAGNVVTFSVLLFVNIPGNALAMAATVLISKRLGQNQTRTARLEMQLILWLASAALIVLGIMTVPFAHPIGAIYTDDPAVIDVVVNLIYLNALMMPIWAASFVLPAAFKGAKDVKYSMWTAILSMWGCRIVLGYLLGIYAQMGIYGIWLGMFADWWLRGTLYLYRMISRRWLNVYLTSRDN
ncbi:EmmdR/YeeO family multidrug/toxin efflux MATE transporter [Vibrio ostreae]|uniref:Multidrug resistance protein NorM n=1 Tax=Vibrio ostreae TaxID=2841925 RepID=A0A975U7C5_9VIBR|nr:EmmdR/YeeO family multidrug/toxin efflux MATE transporter [Vibrio ostreae]WGY45867.1 EmmdR/YeeO family multidrug/toxin efflux MATE transporter [Vibrio sp. ABG19]